MTTDGGISRRKRGGLLVALVFASFLALVTYLVFVWWPGTQFSRDVEVAREAVKVFRDLSEKKTSLGEPSLEPRKVDRASLPAPKPELTRECIDLWADLQAFSFGGLVEKNGQLSRAQQEDPMGFTLALLRKLPDSSRCVNVPGHPGVVLEEYRRSCGGRLKAGGLGVVAGHPGSAGESYRVAVSRCVKAATMLRFALTDLVVSSEGLANVRDADLLFDRLFYLVAFSSWAPEEPQRPGERQDKGLQFAREKLDVIQATADRLLQVGQKEEHRVAAAAFYAIARLQKLGIDVSFKVSLHDGK